MLRGKVWVKLGSLNTSPTLTDRCFAWHLRALLPGQNEFLKLSTHNNKKINSELIKLTDNIFYNTGLYDKLYYDSSLIHNNIYECDNNVVFEFLDLKFKEPESVFYFSKPINFVGGLWYNIYD